MYSCTLSHCLAVFGGTVNSRASSQAVVHLRSRRTPAQHDDLMWLFKVGCVRRNPVPWFFASDLGVTWETCAVEDRWLRSPHIATECGYSAIHFGPLRVESSLCARDHGVTSHPQHEGFKTAGGDKSTGEHLKP